MTDAASMAGKTVLVTGANSGIGLEASVVLAGMGARVVLACRNPQKADAARSDVVARSGNDDVHVLSLDLASLAAVRRAAETFLATYDRLDVLVNNAGLVQLHRSETADGFETTFGVNHLGHFHLTTLLLERLRASAPARVVTVASDAHRSAFRGLNFGDLQTTKRYFSFDAYAKSKLANILFTRELAQRLTGTGVTANCLHPGFVASNFAKEGDTGRLGEIAMRLGKPFAVTPAQGAQTTVYLATSPEVADVSGEYFAKCAKRTPTKWGRDDAAARRLWQVSEQLVTQAGG